MFSSTPHNCGTSNHRMEPRYDETPVDIEVVKLILDKVDTDFMDDEDIRNLTFQRKYIKDICTYCGKESGR